jgi:hypothetical protein
MVGMTVAMLAAQLAAQ